MVSLVRGAMLVVTLICWGMSLYKLRDLVRDPGNKPLRALWIAMVAITLSLTIQPTMPRIDQLVGVVDFARIVSNCLSLTCATAAIAFLLYMTSSDAPTQRQVRNRVAALGVTVVIMAALFIATPPAVELSDPRVIDGKYYGDPYNAPYMYAYLAYLGWSLSQVVRLAIRYARIAHRPLLRFGLRLITIGSLFGLGYVAAKLLAVVAGALWPGSALITDSVVVFCFTVSILLVLIGSTIPSWGPRLGLDRVWVWAAALRDYYRLRPLWSAIHEVLPEIALLPKPRGLGGLLTIARDASLRRVRTTVEILDGYASLRPWMSGQAFTQARRTAEGVGLRGERLAAATEAAVVGAALASRHRGWPPAADSDEVPMLPTGAPSPDRGDGTNGGAAEQVTWLTQVAHVYRTRVVSSILAQLVASAVPTSAQASER